QAIWRAVDLGHAAGDELLEEPADLARSHHRIEMRGECLSDLGTQGGDPEEIRDTTALTDEFVEHGPRLVGHIGLDVDHRTSSGINGCTVSHRTSRRR